MCIRDSVPLRGPARGAGGLARKPIWRASSAPELLRRLGSRRSNEGRPRGGPRRRRRGPRTGPVSV
eukprot:8280185-Alexandrium_andersonii.AAC.1